MFPEPIPLFVCLGVYLLLAAQRVADGLSRKDSIPINTEMVVGQKKECFVMIVSVLGFKSC